jgi:hypothetical protein
MTVKQNAQRITFRPIVIETGELGDTQTVVLKRVQIGARWLSGRRYRGQIEELHYIDTSCIASREQQYVDLPSGDVTYRKIENNRSANYGNNDRS